MRSPKDMKIIQIDITNVCPHSCSNCTRFCGHHKKPFFMDFDTFRNAVDSLEDYPGMVGMIGGEPTIHPEFEKFAKYLRDSRLGCGNRLTIIREPLRNMLPYMQQNLQKLETRLGLWSSLNEGYYKHFEVINDTFPTQFLNDHDNACIHQALLMPRKELGIPDDEWIKKRDACWIQNTWSATITPKGAFFCEVAGALDMLFDGPGGWKVEPNWWKRTPAEFGEQLKWCERCSGCLDVPQRISNDERDDMTPEVYNQLKAAGSPKIKQGKYVVHDPKTFDKSCYHTFTGANDYMDAAGNIRTSNKNRNYYPKNFYLAPFDYVRQIPANKNIKDWVVLSNDIEQGKKIFYFLQDCVINPGVLYLTDTVSVFNVRASSLRKFFNTNEELPENFWNYYPSDKVVKLDIC